MLMVNIGLGMLLGVLAVIVTLVSVWFVRAELFGQGIALSYLKYRWKRGHGRDRALRL